MPPCIAIIYGRLLVSEGDSEMAKLHGGYNGWKNYATWNVALWVDNEYGIYLEKVDYLKRLGRRVRGKDVRQFCEQYFIQDYEDEHGNTLRGYGTPDTITNDWRGGRWRDVSWAEIAEHWELERKEIIQ